MYIGSNKGDLGVSERLYDLLSWGGTEEKGCVGEVLAEEKEGRKKSINKSAAWWLGTVLCRLRRSDSCH